MVEGGLAIVEDTGSLEAPVGGIDCNGDGLTVYSGSQGTAA